MSNEMMRPSGHRGGQLYMQTNETRNSIVHYHWSANGTLTEVERLPTGGAGSGEFKPTSGQESAPNAFEGARSVILSSNRRLLFATNGGDNSVSSFALDDGGMLTPIDVKPTGNAVKGKSGTAKALAYHESTRTLVVLHSLGPDHIRLMSVDADGKLTLRPERYTMNTHDKTERVPTMAAFSPDGRFLLVGTVFDIAPVVVGSYPDGSPILWVSTPDGRTRSIASNAPDPDGMVVFPVSSNGALGQPSYYDAGGGSPFFIEFLHNRPDTFIVGYAVGDGVGMGHIDEEGRIDMGTIVPIDTSAGKPSELCWLSLSPDDSTLFATNFGYSDIARFISAASSRSRRIPRARRFRATARSGRCVETSAAARVTAGSRPTAPISTRSTVTPRSSSVTRPSPTAPWRKSPASGSHTTARRAWRGSDLRRHAVTSQAAEKVCCAVHEVV